MRAKLTVAKRLDKVPVGGLRLAQAARQPPAALDGTKRRMALFVLFGSVGRNLDSELKRGFLRRRAGPGGVATARVAALAASLALWLCLVALDAASPVFVWSAAVLSA